MIPATAIVITKNDSENLAHCLLPLVTAFARVIVVDSGSTDDTMQTAKSMGADFQPFGWNGKYPKKRQWCLENIYGLGPWVFFIEADEIVTHDLIMEMRLLFARGVKADGYFVRRRPVWMGKLLRFGAADNHLRLFRRDKFAWPVVDDLHIKGMDDHEGPYEPVAIEGAPRIGQLGHAMRQHNHKGRGDWDRRSARYANWEAEITRRNLWPVHPVAWREEAAKFMRASVLKPYLWFVYSYILRGGFLDGVAGFDYAYAQLNHRHNVQKILKDR